MTEAEELELLELEKQKAESAQPKPPATPSRAADTTAGQAFVENLGNAGTFGLGDEIGAGIQAGLGLLHGDTNVGQNYREALADNRRILHAANEQHPYASAAGGLTGGVLNTIATSPVALAKLGAVGKGASSLLNASKSATVLGRLGQAAKVGATTGALYGLGSNENDLTSGKLEDYLGAAKDTALGGAGGAAIGSTLQGAGELVKGAYGGITNALSEESLRNTAREQALKAAGYIQKDLNKLSQAQQDSIADTLLQQGIIKAGQKPDAVLPGARQLKATAGQAIGNVLGDADKAAEAGTAPPFRVGEMTDKLRANLLSKLDDPALKSQRSSLEDLISGYEALPTTETGFTSANKLKTNLAKTISKFQDAPAAQEWKVAAQGLMDDEIERQLEASRGPSALDALKDAKTQYGAAKETIKAASGAAKRMAGNSKIGLRDTITGAAVGGPAAASQLMHGNLVGAALSGAGGLATAYGAKLAREHGSSIAAVVADKLANGAAERAAAKIGRAASPQWIRGIQQTLANAAQRGPAAEAVTHYLLAQTDPMYQAVNEDDGLAMAP